MNSPHIQWAIETLNSSGYRLENTNPEIILETAWSQVYRFLTNRGFVYLKKVPPALWLEVNVIELLQEQFYAPVPHILAQNQENHCFMMRDAGVPVHDFFKQEFNANVLIEAMQHYAMLQLNCADKIELFLNLGVPDWRLSQLPNLYQQLLGEEKLLLEDGLSPQELKILHHLDSKLLSICEQLAQYKIPDTFGHADFHDKNILVNPQTCQITLIDLGEVVITHPFFSFVDCLYRATEHLKLSHPQYRELQEACFKKWLSIESSVRLFEIITIIQQCWSIHAVLGEYRLLKSVDPIASMQLCRKGRFAGKLRIWIEQAETI
jgi:aminoglycoside/choline kinase family phosphotransferase